MRRKRSRQTAKSMLYSDQDEPFKWFKIDLEAEEGDAVQFFQISNETDVSRKVGGEAPHHPSFCFVIYVFYYCGNKFYWEYRQLSI